VLKSLVMLAASGVDIEADAVVPIIVDPDFANADLTRTINQIKKYSAVREKLGFSTANKNQFFKLLVEQAGDDYRLALNDTKNKKFKDFIGYDTLSKENRALSSILFSQDNLEADMEVGFKGNPNMGSVVLNQFTSSKDFVDFAAAFKPGDRIFIISSIFGGTGASGFPVLLKNIRGIDSSLPNCDAISKAPIGAITVLPYFALSPNPNSAIDSSTFTGKTKAALHYYENNVTGEESSVNALYYIGDSRNKQYSNEQGGTTQRNNAHIVELAAALAVVDFANIGDTDPVVETQTNAAGRIFAPHPVFKEFGIEEDREKLIFGNLSHKTQDTLKKSLTQFVLFSKYLTDESVLKQGLSLPWAKDNSFDDAFLKSPFVEDLRSLCYSYLEWLREMSDNDRSFEPFNLDVEGKDIFNIVSGVKAGKIMSLDALGKSGYDLYNIFLSSHKALPKDYSKEQKFVELFYIVTKDLVEKKYKF